MMRCLKHKYQKYKKRKMKQKNTFMHRDDLSNDNKNYTHELRDANKNYTFEDRRELKNAIKRYPSNINIYGDISNWNVSKVKNMSCLFMESQFNGDISNWDVSNVVNMDGM